MKKRLTEEELKLVYKVEASPIFWRQKAEQLKHSAEVLWPDVRRRMDIINRQFKLKGDVDFDSISPDIFPICKALMGYSLECLFKAAIIRNNPGLVANGKLSKLLKSHDLIKLAEIGKITLTQNEKIFCESATEMMVIDSRYPVGLEVKPHKGIIRVGGHFKKVFTGLYKKIHPTVGQFHTATGKVIDCKPAIREKVRPKTRRIKRRK